MISVSDIQIAASLIDDYLQLEDAPIPDGSTRFVAAQNPATHAPATLLAVYNDSNNDSWLKVFSPDSRSHSGWSTCVTKIPLPYSDLHYTPGGPVTRLDAFWQDNVLYVFAYWPVSGADTVTPVVLQSEGPGQWTEMKLGFTARALTSTMQHTQSYQDADGQIYMYGGAFFDDVRREVSSFVLLYQFRPGAWWSVNKEFSDFTPPLIGPTRFKAIPGLGGNQFTIFWWGNDASGKCRIYWQGASLVQNQLKWAGTATELNIAITTASELIPLPAASFNHMILLRDGEQVTLIEGFDAANGPALRVLTGQTGQPSAVTAVSAGLDDQGVLSLFAEEAGTARLWIMRQTGADPFTFSWAKLGNLTSAIACPPNMGAGPELFLVDLKQNLFHFTQTADDKVWTTRKIAAPTSSATAPRRVAATTMNVTTVSAAGAPVGGAVVYVSTDQPIFLIASDFVHFARPGSDATLAADGTGQLTVSFQTTGLAAPVLLFQVVNPDKSVVSRWCQGDVVEIKPGETAIPPCPQSVALRLNNQDPSLPITPENLKANGLLNSSYAHPNEATSSVIACGQYMLKNAQGKANLIDIKSLRTPHWRADFTDPSGPRFTALTETEARGLLAASAGPGDGWDIFGDVINWFKHAWKEIKSIVCTIVDDALHIIINGFDYAIRTLRQAASALEAVFVAIGQGLEDVFHVILEVIDFIKQLFDWDDILSTHRVIKWSVQQLVAKTAASTDDMTAWIDGAVGAVEDTIDDAIGGLAAKLEGQGTTFNAFAPSKPPFQSAHDAKGPALAGGPAVTARTQNGPRCNYIHSKAKSGWSGSTSLAGLMTAGAVDTSPILDQVTKHWAGSTFNEKTKSFQNNPNSSAAHPHSLFDGAIVGFLEACRDLIDFILNGLRDVADAVLSAAKTALGLLLEVLEHEIDIPIISWLYTHVIAPREKLTILDVYCLGLAVPSTILYKILQGGSAPFNQKEADALTQGDIHWPTFTAGQSAALSVEDAAGAVSPSTIEALGLVAGFCNFFGTFSTAGADALAFAVRPDTDLATFLSYACVVQGLVTQACSAPFAVFNKPRSNWTKADGWTVALWAVAGVPVIYDAVFTFATNRLARYTQELGPVLDTGSGFLLTGLGAATLAEQLGDGSYTKWDCANSVVPQPGRLFRFLILDAPNPDSLAVLVGADVVVGIGSTITQIGASIADN